MSEANLELISSELFEVMAYSDSAGLGTEFLTYQEIYTKHGHVSQLLAPGDNPFFYNESEPGVWSDDTQMALAVGTGMVRAGGFDLAAIAKAHIEEYQATPRVDFEDKVVPRGWGGSTVRSMEKLVAGVPPTRSGEDGFNEKGEPIGVGNAVLTKMAPLVLWQHANAVFPDDERSQFDALTRMTHNTDMAVACTRLHGEVLHHLLAYGYEGDQESLVDLIDTRAHEIQQEIGTIGHELSSALSYLWGYRYMSDMDIMQETDGRGFYAPQTLAMAYGAFLLDGRNFKNTVYTAVNLGGDTDSLATLAGTMVLFGSDGRIDKPADWDKIQQRVRLQQAGQALAQLIKTAR